MLPHPHSRGKQTPDGCFQYPATFFRAIKLANWIFVLCCLFVQSQACPKHFYFKTIAALPYQCGYIIVTWAVDRHRNFLILNAPVSSQVQNQTHHIYKKQTTTPWLYWGCLPHGTTWHPPLLGISLALGTQGAPPCPVRYWMWIVQILMHSKRKGCNHDVNTKIHHTTSHVLFLAWDMISSDTVGGGQLLFRVLASWSSPEETRFGSIPSGTWHSRSSWSPGLTQFLACAGIHRMLSKGAQGHGWNTKEHQSKSVNNKACDKIGWKSRYS